MGIIYNLGIAKANIAVVAVAYRKHTIRSVVKEIFQTIKKNKK